PLCLCVRLNWVAGFARVGLPIHRNPETRKPAELPVDSGGRALLQCVPVMGQQLRKRLKRQRREARNKRLKERLRAGMKK
ncbi:MAG TPA: hypothetical protein P5026_13545, partial [Kiritimatiellia bacterium]|nr:hypothetical protein [Kiritimatiellia bacterium]HRU71731.1 hypothetical protein [Kiritimatiellia bacterium]